MPPDEDFDVAIIGAGHNGLVCANYLARANLRVFVAEARKIVGGACTSEELIPGATFSSCSYIQMMLRQEIVDDLELARHGLVSVAPSMQEMALWADGDHVQLWHDVDRTLRSMERHSKPDAAGFARFATRLQRFGDITRPLLLGDPPTIRELRAAFDREGEADLYEEFISMSAEELLARYIKSERLRGFLMFMGMVSTWGGPRTPGTAYVYGYHAQGEFDGQFGRYGLPRGGMGAISHALTKSLAAHGGIVRTSAPVECVLLDGNRARGFVLSSGETIRAKIVVSGADPHRSLVSLLPKGALPDDARAAAEAIDQRGSMARIHLLIDALPDYVGFPAGQQGPQHEGLAILGATPALYEKAWQAQQAGEFADDYVIEALIPSVTDPTVAKPGLHTLSLGVQQLPMTLARGDWSSRKEEWGDLVMAIFDRYAPNIRHHIRGRHVITPLDLERNYNLTGGNIFHASMVGADNLFENRPIRQASNYRTPIENYYLCGSGSHPGGGVSGVPGHNAAQRILADLAGQRDRPIRRAATARPNRVIQALLRSEVGQRLGYAVARSRMLRSLTARLTRTR